MGLSNEQFEEQFSSLIDEKLSMLRGVSLRIVNSSADADDAVQTALLKAWKNRKSFRNTAALSSWVTRIVISESYNLLRERLNHDSKIAGMEEHDPTPSSDLYEENLMVLDQLIAGLPSIYREAVHIGILGDMDAKKAAEILECSVNTLYQRIHKAKELLRKNYGSLKHE